MFNSQNTGSESYHFMPLEYSTEERASKLSILNQISDRTNKEIEALRKDRSEYCEQLAVKRLKLQSQENFLDLSNRSIASDRENISKLLKEVDEYKEKLKSFTSDNFLNTKLSENAIEFTKEGFEFEVQKRKKK